MDISNEVLARGIKNEKEIESLGKTMGLMIEHLTEAIEGMDKKFENLEKRVGERIDTLQSNVNGRIDTVDKSLGKIKTQLEDLEKNLPKKIDERIETKWKTGVYGVIKWLLIAATSTAVGFVVKMILEGI